MESFDMADLANEVASFPLSPPHPTVEFLPHEEDDAGSGVDIYRGGPSSPPRTPPPETISSDSSSSSSSGSFVFGGRLGAISQLVEHAISHWARAWGSSSSLTSSSSSSSVSTNSMMTRARSKASRKRNRRSSMADLHNARSEREVAARIRAREQARQIPRQFALYSPPGEGPAKPNLGGIQLPADSDEQGGALRTESLPLIISRLSIALKDNLKSRRAREIAHLAAASESSSSEPSAYSTPVLHHIPHVSTDAAAFSLSQLPPAVEPSRRKARKGKHRAGRTGLSAPRVTSERDIDKAWWLDVSSPTPQDMRAIGKLLQIHPLTLEDILLQDPREKFELFSSLGYYFVAFRTIESKKTRERRRLRMLGDESQRIDVLDEGIVGIVNVYLVIFREGICSFHFADISDHINTVRNRVLKLDDPATMSPDWIAHGIMDSIVDSFFPFLEDIEKEVVAIEALVFSTNAYGDQADHLSVTSSSSSITMVSTSPKSQKSPILDQMDPLSIKHEDTIHSTGAKTHFSLPYSYRVQRRWRIIRGYFRHLRKLLPFGVRNHEAVPSTTTTTIHRMARTRRLVTSLTRVLAAKSEVVTQLKKRLLRAGEAGLGEGMGDDRDVFMYMGDVQDHILTLQQSLAHYERMLSQSHPTYLTELRLAVSKTKSGADKAIVFLSVVSMGVLCVQTLIGLNSMNFHIPGNRHPGGSYRTFFIVIALAFIIIMIYGSIVRTWWVSAKKKRSGRL